MGHPVPACADWGTCRGSTGGGAAATGGESSRRKHPSRHYRNLPTPFAGLHWASKGLARDNRRTCRHCVAMRARPSTMRRTLLWITGLVVAACLLGVSVVSYGLHLYRHGDVLAGAGSTEFDVPKGQGASSLPAILAGARIDVAPWQLSLLWRLRGDSEQVKAGRYAFTGPLSLARLMDDLVKGQPARERTIALIEGWTFRQFRDAIGRAQGLANATAGLSEAQILEKLGIDDTRAEGWFAPDSYRYVEGGSDLELLGRAHKLQKERLAKAWEGRDADLPLATPRDMLILASIIEKETSHDDDRALVSAVFQNRLRKGMMLQSDPTTIYGMGEAFDGNLRRRDLKNDTPYNTYTRTGLTPTPISMPGKASLEAAAKPDDSKALYFVARGDGTSHFSEDLRSHNRAVNRYQRNR
ncbi:MAG: endolytic transglycosylase MltG [Lautropia sp.]